MKKNIIKQITLALLIILITGAATLGISKAVFQDEELAQSTISLGTLNLQVGQSDPINVPLDFSGMSAGEERVFAMDIQNTGQLAGNFWVHGEITSSTEGENPEPETDIEGEGELDDCARLIVTVDDNQGQTLPVINNLLLKDITADFEEADGNTIDQAINNGPTQMQIKVNTDNCDSDAMGDTANINLLFYLSQSV